MYYSKHMRDFFEKVECISPRDTDTEENVLDDECFDVRDPEQRAYFAKIAESWKLRPVTITETKMIYMADKELGFGLYFYIAKGGVGSRIAIKYHGNFKYAFKKPNEKKGKLQRKLCKYYPDSSFRIYRLDTFKDVVIKDRYWLLGVDEIFPSFISNKEKYPDSKENRPARYVNETLNEEIPNVGYNDNIEPKRRGRKMTHMTVGSFSRQAKKTYDKTASETRLLKKGKITVERYRSQMLIYGAVTSGEHKGKMKRVIRDELVLKSDYAHFLSVMLTEARARGAKEKEQRRIINLAVAHWASQHRLIDCNTIPESGDLSEAKTHPVYYFMMDMGVKKRSQKEEFARLALGVGLDEEALDKAAPLPTPRKNIDKAIASLAKIINRNDLSGQDLLDIVNEYLPKKVLEEIASQRQEKYERFYYFYSQKALLATSESERLFYMAKAKEVKDEGYSVHHIKSLYRGDEAQREPTLTVVNGELADAERALLRL